MKESAKNHLRAKWVYFVIEGLNAFACTYYFNYFFFLLRDRFGFANRETLLVSALHGLLFAIAAWMGGRFAERFGPLIGLRLGAAGMAASLAFASTNPELGAQLTCMCAWTFAMMFTWPALEAVVAQGESSEELPSVIGVYNCIWSGSGAIAYFSGGAIFESLGERSLYWLPAGLNLIILVLIAKVASQLPPLSPLPETKPRHQPEATARSQAIPPETFLKMAWLANPFAYIALNTLLAVMPQIALRLELTTTQIGVVGSVWMFARVAAFALLWHWTGWHYRFRWLAGAFLGLIAGFLMSLLAETVWALVIGQLLLGVCAGLIYYSSLFYSLDIGETKSEHGGFHEAAIGTGIFLGPAVGGLALQMVPSKPNAGAWAVAGLLLIGFAGLEWLRRRRASKAG